VTPQKHPLFTKKVFSTKSFGPGHIIGAGILVGGIIGISKLFIVRGREDADRVRQQAQPSTPLQANARGQYGKSQ
jgi:hypothetical protein